MMLVKSGGAEAKLILLPGMDGSGLLFADFVRISGFDCKTVSYPPSRALGYTELEELVAAALPLDRPFVLLAESFAGPLAIRLASKAPPGLLALILVCTFAVAPLTVPRVVSGAVKSIPLWRMPLAASLKVLANGFESPQLRSRLHEAMSSVSSSVWRSRISSVLEVDVRRELARIAVPILCLRASQDRVVTRSASEIILSTKSDVEVVELEGPHFLLQTQPQEAAAVIRRFLDRHSMGRQM